MNPEATANAELLRDLRLHKVYQIRTQSWRAKRPTTRFGKVIRTWTSENTGYTLVTFEQTNYDGTPSRMRSTGTTRRFVVSPYDMIGDEPIDLETVHRADEESRVWKETRRLQRAQLARLRRIERNTR